jgi:hypothetical protein
MRLTLHIGTAKSGSTSLQVALSRSALSLARAGVYYDHRTLNQNRLELLVRDPSRWTRQHRSMDDGARARGIKQAEEIVARLRKATTGRRYAEAIVSSEYLSLFNAGEAGRLLDRLDLPDVEIQVVCYVRRPSHHWLSVSQQLLKASSRFPAAIDYRYSLQKKLEAWQSDSRVRRMIVRPSDRSQLVRGSIVSDFVANVVPAAVMAEVDVRANESMTAEMAILQQRFRAATHPDMDNRSTQVGRRVFEAILEVSRDVPGTPLQARQDLLDLVDKQHVATLRWLKSTYGVQLVPADELDRLETLAIDPSLGRETRVEEICRSFNQDALDRLSAGVLYHLAREEHRSPVGRTLLARLGSRIRRGLTGRY